MAAGKPAAEDIEVEGGDGGGEGYLAEEEWRRWSRGGDPHEDLVAEHGIWLLRFGVAELFLNFTFKKIDHILVDTNKIP